MCVVRRRVRGSWHPGPRDGAGGRTAQTGRADVRGWWHTGDDGRVDWLERSGGLACYRRGGATRVLGMADDEAGRVLEPLGEAECMGLLADGGLGRLVYN